MDSLQDVLAYVAENETIVQRLVGTLALILASLVLRSAALRFIRTLRWGDEAQRLTWHLRVRHAFIALLLIGVVIIWASQLRSLALSAVAIAAALVLATRELFLCLTGAFVRTATEAYSVGDRIEIDGVRGDVVSYGLLGTTLLETGPNHQRTGRAVIIPNSILVAQKIINESFTEEYVLHIFAVPMDEDDDWEGAEKQLLEISKAVCSEHIDAARKHMDALARRHGLPRSTVDPRITLQMPEPGLVQLLVRVPAHARAKGQVEQAILHQFLRGRRERRDQSGEAAPASRTPRRKDH